LSTQPDPNNYARFVKTFPVTQEDIIDHLVTAFHPGVTPKQRLSIRYDLARILDATFRLSERIGFAKVTVRDLQQESGVSMGGLYKVFANKEMLEHMVLEGLKFLTDLSTDRIKIRDRTDEERISMTIKGYVYISTLFRPWYHFAFAQAGAMAPENVAHLKRLQVGFLDFMTSMLSGKIILASHIANIIQDFYLRPWKYREVDLDSFANHCVKMTLLLKANSNEFDNFQLTYRD
jgi:AcrR family transcriptional regulator